MIFFANIIMYLAQIGLNVDKWGIMLITRAIVGNGRETQMPR